MSCRPLRIDSICFFFQHSRWVDVFSQLIRAIEVKIYCWDRVKRVCCHEMYCLFGNNFVAPSLWWEIVLKWFLEYVTTRNNNERMIQKKYFDGCRNIILRAARSIESFQSIKNFVVNYGSDVLMSRKIWNLAKWSRARIMFFGVLENLNITKMIDHEHDVGSSLRFEIVYKFCTSTIIIVFK